MTLSAKPHHPPHLFLANTWTMVTAATYRRGRFLAEPTAKDLVREGMVSLGSKLGLTIRAWVILDDHYHLLLKAPEEDTLPRFFQALHGGTSHELNTREGIRGRQVWHNYWDTCIRTDTDFWTRFNYIHWNPVKHGYVARPEEWEFSSLGKFLGSEGVAWVEGIHRRFPSEGFTDREDAFLDLRTRSRTVPPAD
jgi:putative transposase